MTGEDVLVESVARGSDAAGSEQERANMLKLLKVFNKDLLARIEDGDVPGIFAGAHLFRAGKSLGVGVILVLGDRAVVSWMKGLLKRPVTEVIPLGSIASVELRRKQVSGRHGSVPCVFLEAGENWELVCSPEVPPEAPLYGLVCALLSEAISPAQWPVGGLAPVVPRM